jgi:RimJ/RimL family protein N-acetyltransferase
VAGEILLRNVTDDDLDVFFDQQREPEANRMAAFAARDRESFIAHWTKILADDALTKRTIVIDGVVAGNIVCFGPPGQREVGYWLGKEHWGQGIATKALASFLDQITDRPLHAHVAKHNLGSIRVLEKCGFTIVGVDAGVADARGNRADEFVMRLA